MEKAIFPLRYLRITQGVGISFSQRNFSNRFWMER